MANGFGLFSCCEPHAKRPPAMTNYKSDLLRLLDERGYIHQTTDAEGLDAFAAKQVVPGYIGFRSEEHTSELQSLMRLSYAAFCLKKLHVARLTTSHYNTDMT